MLDGKFVYLEQGTGIVHCATSHGADDFNLCLKNNIPSAIVRGVKEALNHPQTKDNDMTLKLDKKNTKSLETLNTPIQINNQRGLSKPKYPPALGEDTKKVLKNI